MDLGAIRRRDSRHQHNPHLRQTVNNLEKAIDGFRLNPIEAMNKLQDAGVVSDNAVWASDVADKDCPTAVDYLMNEKLKV